MRESLPVVSNRKNSPALEVLLLPLSSLEPAVRAMVGLSLIGNHIQLVLPPQSSPACLPISMFALLVSLSLVSIEFNTWFPSISTTETPRVSLPRPGAQFGFKILIQNNRVLLRLLGIHRQGACECRSFPWPRPVPHPRPFSFSYTGSPTLLLCYTFLDKVPVRR